MIEQDLGPAPATSSMEMEAEVRKRSRGKEVEAGVMPRRSGRARTQTVRFQ